VQLGVRRQVPRRQQRIAPPGPHQQPRHLAPWRWRLLGQPPNHLRSMDLGFILSFKDAARSTFGWVTGIDGGDERIKNGEQMLVRNKGGFS
jgi:hypothetical protein